MRYTRTAAALVAVTVAAGCSGEDIAERVIENRIESEAGEDVDIDLDLDDGGISIQTEDGEFSIDVDEDDDGNVSISGSSEEGDFTIESEDGETVIQTEDGTISSSASGDLPDDFPASIPIPDGLAIEGAQSMTSPDGDSYIVVGALEGAPDDLTDDFVAALEGAGFEQVQLTSTPDGSFFGYDDGTHFISGAFGVDDADTSRTILSLTVLPSQQG